MNYILGTGIVGLILGIKNHDYKLIGRDKGQIGGKYSLGPRIIQYTEKTEKFLLDLKFKVEIETINIGYQYKDATYHNLDDIPVDFRTEYSLFTRGKKEYEKSFLSAGQNTIKAIRLDGRTASQSFLYLGDKLYDILEKRNAIIIDTITDIDLKNNNIFGYEHTYSYNNVISTLSQNIFQKMIPRFINEEDLELKNKNFIITDPCFKDNNYFYTYNLEQYSRRTFFNDYQVFEIPNDNDYKIIEKEFNNFKVRTKISIPIQLKSSLKIKEHPQYNNVKFEGRFAQWDHSILINNIIDQN